MTLSKYIFQRRAGPNVSWGSNLSEGQKNGRGAKLNGTKSKKNIGASTNRSEGLKNGNINLDPVCLKSKLGLPEIGINAPSKWPHH